jgi:hypothetical protein
VILEERQPAFARITAALYTSKIPGDGPFGGDEAELLKFSMNLGGSPVRVLCRQPPNQRPDLIGDLWAAALRLGPPAPVETKPARCQPMTVSGFTMTRTSAQRDQKQWRVVQKSRSREFSIGRGRLRLSTATCCRRARTSRAVSLRLRRKTRSCHGIRLLS